MKKLLCILLPALLGLSGCGVLRCPKPELQVRDSLVLHIKDSLAIRYIPVEVPVPVEVMREIIPSSDSSHLETSVARSDAFIDSTGHAEKETVVKEVEKPLSWWQKFWQVSGIVLWSLLGAGLVVLILKIKH